VLLQQVEDPDDEALLRYGQRLEALAGHRSRREPAIPDRWLWSKANELVNVQAEQLRKSLENQDGNLPVPVS